MRDIRPDLDSGNSQMFEGEIGTYFTSNWGMMEEHLGMGLI